MGLDVRCPGCHRLVRHYGEALRKAHSGLSMVDTSVMASLDIKRSGHAISETIGLVVRRTWPARPRGCLSLDQTLERHATLAILGVGPYIKGTGLRLTLRDLEVDLQRQRLRRDDVPGGRADEEDAVQGLAGLYERVRLFTLATEHGRHDYF